MNPLTSGPSTTTQDIVPSLTDNSKSAAAFNTQPMLFKAQSN